MTVLTSRDSNWWATRVARPIREFAEQRMHEEGENRWHGKRGVHPIFYTTISHLVSIIASNWADLKPYIGKDQPWVRVKVEEVELSRNIIAHHNPLDERDIGRVELDFEDWIRQIRSP